jgi:hypothetical protein
MAIECRECERRGVACQDCVVTVIAPRGTTRRLEAEELRALQVLADAGMIPPLRLNAPRARVQKVPNMPRTWAFPDTKAS